MLDDIEGIVLKYINQAAAIDNGIIGNPFWGPGTVREMMDYSAEVAARRRPLSFISYPYPYQHAFQRVLKRDALKNKKNLLFLVERLMACGHDDYTVKLMAPLLRHLKGRYRERMITALAGNNSYYIFAHVRLWTDDLMEFMIKRLTITDVKFIPYMKKIYKIIARKPNWLKMFINHYSASVRKMTMKDNCENNRLLLSLIDDLDGFEGVKNNYLIDKIQEWITKDTIDVYISRLTLLMTACINDIK